MATVTIYAYCNLNYKSYLQNDLVIDKGKGDYIAVYYLFGGEKFKKKIPFGDKKSYIALQIPKNLITIEETNLKVNFVQKGGEDLQLPVSKVTVEHRFLIAYLEKRESQNSTYFNSEWLNLDSLNDDTLKNLIKQSDGEKIVINDTSSKPIHL